MLNQKRNNSRLISDSWWKWVSDLEKTHNELSNNFIIQHQMLDAMKFSLDGCAGQSVRVGVNILLAVVCSCGS